MLATLQVKERLPNFQDLRKRFPVRLSSPFKQREETPREKPPPPPKQAIQDAVRSKTIGFGFSAGGMLFPYYLGVLEALTELDIVTGEQHLAAAGCRLLCSRPHASRRVCADETPLGGASAGSLLVACHHVGLPIEMVTDACLRLAADCR